MTAPTASDSVLVAGLDLGQASDFTALAVLERPRFDANTQWKHGRFPAYTLRYIQRYQLGTSYPDVVADVLAKAKQVPGLMLVLDGTGVGRGVVDLFRQAGHPLPVTITAGHAVTVDDSGYWHVPKRDLAGVLQALFQTARLRIPQLPQRDLLVRELTTFKVKVNTATGNESFEAWRSRDRDDMVLAVALAAWAAERLLAAEHQAAAARPQVRRLT